MRLDGPAPYVSVPHTKTGVPKKAPLPRVAVEALKTLPSYGVDDYVFPSKVSGRWPNPKQPYRWDFGKEFRQLVRSLGVDGVRLHDLRYRALRALDAGHSWRRGEEDNGPPMIAQVLFSDTRTDTPDGRRRRKRCFRTADP